MLLIDSRYEVLQERYGPAGSALDLRVFNEVFPNSWSTASEWTRDQTITPVIFHSALSQVSEPWYIGPGLYAVVETGQEPRLWNPSQAWNAAGWALELMASRAGYDRPGYTFDGPLYKPESAYLTSEGFPLSTTCWYVYVATGGFIARVCHPSDPKMAICYATLWCCEQMEAERQYDENRRAEAAKRDAEDLARRSGTT